MDQLIFIINIAVALGGVYIVIETLKMKKTHKIAGQIYLSSDLQMRKCKREEEYCEYVAPKGILCGILAAILALLAALGYFFDALVFFKNWSFVFLIGIYVWFLTYTGKANNTFF